MTKADLILQLAEENNLSTREATSIINTILKTITDALVQGESIELRGFCSFTIRSYDAYEGKNPRTGKTVMVKPKRLPFFKVGKDLRERVNKRN